MVNQRRYGCIKVKGKENLKDSINSFSGNEVEVEVENFEKLKSKILIHKESTEAKRKRSQQSTNLPCFMTPQSLL